MSDALPEFRFYPGAGADETFVRSDAVCAACERARGWVTTAILYSASKPEDAEICPWCVADGRAAERFDGTFNELEAGVLPELDAELTRRTPGFSTWQDWDWPAHCAEPAVYLGQPRGAELRKHPDAIEDLRSQSFDFGWSPEEFDELVDAFDPEGSAVAYLFRCGSCGTHLTRWDQD